MIEIDEDAVLFPTLPADACHISGCRKQAEWEGWMGRVFVTKVRVCDEHKKLLRGYDQEK
jgi:hypothetical protein